MLSKSIRHLKENNMGYWEHFKFASKHGTLCIMAGLLLILHSIMPAFFSNTGSNLVNKLNNE